MLEKLSERSIRQEKVDCLKTRLKKQINELLIEDIETLQQGPFLTDDTFARIYIDEIHALYVLRDYLDDDAVFMRAHAIYEDQDGIVYRVRDDTIEWMLQESGLLHTILFNIKRCGGCAEIALNEEFFEYKVFGVMERCIHDRNSSVTVRRDDR